MPIIDRKAGVSQGVDLGGPLPMDLGRLAQSHYVFAFRYLPAADRAGPYLLPPGEVRRHLTSWLGATTGLKAGSRDTAGLLAVLEGALAPWAPGPPLHLHTRNDEMLSILEGSLLVQIGEERHELSAGDFAWIPRNTPHTFANAAATPARGLTLAAPGGLEELLAEQGEYLAQLHGTPDPAELSRIGARHGSHLLGAPITAPGAQATPHG